MYRRISESLADPSLLKRLKRFFREKQTLTELLEWVHTKLTFCKGNITRHNDPFEIIKYGKGKCREFSVLFTAVCLANGYRARLILDMSDHAWTEIWTPQQNRWIHFDPSEKRVDDAEMYERDWKKDLKEVFAFEKGNIENVTKTYKMSSKRYSRGVRT
ncbi:MAG: transglutaminase domain-containing protein [Candidatus Bathyarchaeota archaeon]|nr:MAG: transglutaminase domain-containing protein [Candidatus Bathyarchaeota archaeon]